MSLLMCRSANSGQSSFTGMKPPGVSSSCTVLSSIPEGCATHMYSNMGLPKLRVTGFLARYTITTNTKQSAQPAVVGE